MMLIESMLSLNMQQIMSRSRQRRISLEFQTQHHEPLKRSPLRRHSSPASVVPDIVLEQHHPQQPVEESVAALVPSPISTVVSDVLEQRQPQQLVESVPDLVPSPISTVEASPKAVHFDNVEVHEHEYILGCSADTAFGLPLTISWTAVSTATVPVDEYEAAREPHRRANFLLAQEPNMGRRGLLEKLGFDNDDIKAAEAHAHKNCDNCRKEAELKRASIQALKNESMKHRMQGVKEKKTRRRGMFSMFMSPFKSKGKVVFPDDTDTDRSI